MKKIVSLLWVVVFASVQPLLSQINSGSPAKPFGSNTSYQYGIMPTNLPTSGTYGASQKAADAYEAWKTQLVEACTDGQFRVKWASNGQDAKTVSEGIAYGMLLSVYAGDKALFDGLWKYYKAKSSSKGIMGWEVQGCGNVNDPGAATDAELDAAMALIIASKQWPNSTSPYNYIAEARTLIGNIKQYEMDQNTGQVLNGDRWNSNSRNPSYFAPAYFKQYAEVLTNQSDKTFWGTTAITASNTILTTNRDNLSGLVSNWCDNSGRETSGKTGYGYGSDACRNPWRMATDYLWHGDAASTAAKDINAKLAAFVGNKAMVGPIGDGSANQRNVATMPPKGNSSANNWKPWENGTYAMFALPAMTASDQANLNTLYTRVVNLGEDKDYFNKTIRCLTLFVLTGNFWSPNATTPPQPPCPTSYTVTFDVDGGSSIPSETVCAGEKVDRPAANPTKTGYAFKNWYTTATGNTEFNFATTTINSNTTIYAQWEKGAGPTVIADCDKGNGSKTNFLTSWYAYDDNSVKPTPGSSVVSNQVVGGAFKMTAPGAAGSDSAAVMIYTLNKGGLSYDPFVGLGFDTKDPAGAYDLSCTSGVTFYYKNSNQIKIRFMVKTSGVTDDAYYGYDLPVESNWKLITIHWSELKQPLDWGTPVDWDAASITGFQWQIQGANGTNGTIGIDQVQLNDCNVVLPGGIGSDVSDINSSVAGIQIYPNPTNGNFNVVLPNSEPAVLSIMNLQGQNVYNAVVENGFVSINAELGTGVYLVSVKSENGLTTQKLIVK